MYMGSSVFNVHVLRNARKATWQRAIVRRRSVVVENKEDCHMSHANIVIVTNGVRTTTLMGDCTIILDTRCQSSIAVAAECPVHERVPGIPGTLSHTYYSWLALSFQTAIQFTDVDLSPPCPICVRI